MYKKMIQVQKPRIDQLDRIATSPLFKTTNGKKDKNDQTSVLMSEKNGEICKSNGERNKFPDQLGHINEQIEDMHEEKETYNEFFESKLYIPSLRANKRELDFFFKILKKAMEKNSKYNIYINLMNILCKNFPSYIGLFAKLWFQCKVLLAEKLILIEFFRQLKINSEIINHFFNYGYDSFETILSITPEDLIKIQKFNNVTWVPGHAFKLKIIFSQIEEYFKLFIRQNDDYVRKIKKIILNKRKKTELTVQLSLEQQKNSVEERENIYYTFSPQTLKNFNTIVYQPHMSLNMRGKNLLYNPLPDKSLYYNKTYVKNYQHPPYSLLRYVHNFFSLHC
ncbi:hypothetical protein, conserved [Plasmodium gonderi]|uniref:Uncharacterized protein n=1 Tax=Plasmodium gonderi TaxID=77519 RepID=A0A1Y1JNL0_PLAGO|nr:hypothetical protein, conserved [Plasmodium gonderi]GAW83840.1 hypothetical protein, conserved [Plasmodium gonderi]